MSGSYFSSRCGGNRDLSLLVEEINRIIAENDNMEVDEYGDRIGRGFNPETIALFQIVIANAERTSKQLKMVDYLLDYDLDEEGFIRAWFDQES